MRTRTAISAIVAAVLLAVVAVSINHRYSDDARIAPIAVNDNPSTRVLVIGDSWVADRVLDEPIRDALARRTIVAQVHSLGYSGERTGKIYEHLAASQETAATCVIVAGINDSIGHFGAHYYAHHIRLLAKLALQRGCSPLIVELPQYDQEGVVAGDAPAYLRVRNLLYRFIFDHGSFAPIDQYRQQARNDIAGLHVNLLNPDPAIGSPTTRPELWENPSHLSAKGRIALADAIASAIFARMHQNVSS
jgi:lysophospholipase L1-like esterase